MAIENPVMDLVRSGEVLMRVENDSMLSAAIQRPRDEKKIAREALGELEIMPEEAKTAFYSIPYKDTRPDGSVKIVKVEGPSVKAAMSLARRWGNCTVGARILNEDDAGVDLEGVFIDLETNFRVARPQRVSKTFRRRGGKIDSLDPGRLVMAIQAGASKAIRGAALSGLPPYLVNAYYKKARMIAGGDPDAKADPKIIQAIIAGFVKFKATQGDLEGYVEKPVTEWTGSEVADLRGLWNAIQDEQTTAEEIFRKEKANIPTPQSNAEAKAAAPESPAGPVVGPGGPSDATPGGGDGPAPPAGDTSQDADLESEARAREEAEATAEAEAAQEKASPAPAPVKIDRGKVWNALLRKAKTEAKGSVALLKELTGKSGMTELDDAQVMELAKKLGA